MKCPKCGEECHRDSVDVGVGVIHGPYGCPGCAWSEWDCYDLSQGQNPVDEEGGAIDQYGGYHPPGSPTALAYRLAEMPSDAKCNYPNCDGGPATGYCHSNCADLIHLREVLD